MPFATATPQKIGKYLGFPASNSSQQTIAAALATVDAMSDANYKAGAIATIETYLTSLDTLAAAILAEAQVDGSTLLPELRREYRRHCALVAIATALDIYADTAGATQV
ncbi:hypothetical protein IQ273_31255 [Nodosilinea sp. LEGE 07298]|uniref:hypothetical protein n=1 Tax=Nodosilinea sp. LEGE 07298 TaxID=2777970 RepID=UPI00187FA818|nr:hypothetical protein [Nodosilinea sp. LEGE 07298]MBE9113851.1 hypothetical protein [Nodosilinea sp. LEGE 07298]